MEVSIATKRKVINVTVFKERFQPVKFGRWRSGYEIKIFITNTVLFSFPLLEKTSSR